jgi:hypothetical protein
MATKTKIKSDAEAPKSLTFRSLDEHEAYRQAFHKLQALRRRESELRREWSALVEAGNGDAGRAELDEDAEKVIRGESITTEPNRASLVGRELAAVRRAIELQTDAVDEAESAAQREETEVRRPEWTRIARRVHSALTELDAAFKEEAEFRDLLERHGFKFGSLSPVLAHPQMLHFVQYHAAEIGQALPRSPESN